MIRQPKETFKWNWDFPIRITDPVFTNNGENERFDEAIRPMKSLFEDHWQSLCQLFTQESSSLHSSQAKIIIHLEYRERVLINFKRMSPLYSETPDGLPVFWDARTDGMQFEVGLVRWMHTSRDSVNVEEIEQIDSDSGSDENVAQLGLVRTNAPWSVKQLVCDAVDFLMSSDSRFLRMRKGTTRERHIGRTFVFVSRISFFLAAIEFPIRRSVFGGELGKSTDYKRYNLQLQKTPVLAY